MKSKIFFSFILILLYQSFALSEEYCAPKKDNSYIFEQLKCSDINDCWLGLVSVEDSFKIIDSQNELKVDMNTNYIKGQDFLFKLNQKHSNFRIEFRDLNKYQNLPNDFCVNVGKFKNVRFEIFLKWFLTTGSTLYSSYVTLIFFILFVLIFFIRKDLLTLSLMTYSFIATFYLFSFSETPRLFFDPEFASGAVHFPLRLLQDTSLVFVFYVFLRKNNSSSWIKYLLFVYFTLIASYLVMILAGVDEYLYYERIIKIFAPLVAAPMATGLYYSLKLDNKFDRKMLIPIAMLLLCCQLNDLFCFWKVYDGFYTVKFYIPFLIVMLFVLYFRSLHNEIISNVRVKEKEKTIQKFIHDLNSPLTVLHTFSNVCLKNNPEHLQLLQQVIRRVESLMYSIKSETLKVYSLPINSLVLSAVKQKTIELSDIKVSTNFKSEQFAYVDELAFTRIISNLLNNSYEAYSTSQEKRVDISIKNNFDKIFIIIEDFGKGITPKNIDGFITGQTNKLTGQGIGLSSSKEYLKQMRGDLKVASDGKSGSRVTIELLKSQPPYWYYQGDIREINCIKIDTDPITWLKQNRNLPKRSLIICNFEYSDELVDLLKMNEQYLMNISDYELRTVDHSVFDIVLVDDDEIITQAWEISLRRSKKSVKIIKNLDDFFKIAQSIPKQVTLYLDRYLGEDDLYKHLDEIEKMNFQKVCLISSDVTGICIPASFEVLPSKLPPILRN